MRLVNKDGHIPLAGRSIIEHVGEIEVVWI
jgi:hypothetical protein